MVPEKVETAVKKVLWSTLIALIMIPATVFAGIPKPKKGEKCQREVSITTRHPTETDLGVYLCGPEAKIRPTVGPNGSVVIRLYAEVPFSVRPYGDSKTQTATPGTHAAYGAVYSAVVDIVSTDGRGIVTEIVVKFDRPGSYPVRMSWPYQWQLPRVRGN